MRLGLIGPAFGDLPGLARVAQRLLDDHAPERILYLGDDDALDRVVGGWAEQIVGDDPSDAAFFLRVARCADATPEAIDEFVARERGRLKLRVYVNLPQGRRTIEILDGRVTLFVHDKATLDEEDILAANVVVFGKHPTPFHRRVGSRTFVSPGVISKSGGGAILDDAGGQLVFEAFAPAEGGGHQSVLREVLAAQSAQRMKVQGS